MQVLNLDNWKRKEHFNHYKQFDEPYFGVTTELDITQAYQKCKAEGISFSLFCHYFVAKVLNEIEEFRYRIKGKEVVVYDRIHVGTTVLRMDKTFSFAFVPYTPSFIHFLQNGKIEFEKVRQTSGLGLNEDTARIDIIHFSTLPWIQFNGLSHARKFGDFGSIPKVSFGKFHDENGVKRMPISVHVHHGLIDGYHIGQAVEALQKLFNYN